MNVKLMRVNTSSDALGPGLDIFGTVAMPLN